MERRVLDFIAEHQLFDLNDQLLLAVSGGADSMVLLNILFKNSFHFEVAHVNYGLRGSDSDNDEKLVKKFCEENKLVFHLLKTDPEKLKSHKGDSLQELARNIRYDWLETLRKERNLKYILTAHQLTDQAETILLNLSRGTGIEGLAGIYPKRNTLIRPLLCVNSMEIRSFAQTEKISFRDDQSNFSDKYRRNIVRNEILPLLRKLNPSVDKTIGDHSFQVQAQTGILKNKIKELEEKYLTVQRWYKKLEINYFINAEQGLQELYEILKKIGFNYATTQKIFLSSQRQSGKRFITHTHELVKDRSFWLIRELEQPQPQSIIISQKTDILVNGMNKIEFQWLDAGSSEFIQSPSNDLILDSQKLRFPLILRKWKDGDYLTPQGLNKKKKISDLLTDMKLSIFEKEQILVLESDGIIAGICGIRGSSAFEVDKKTGTFLRVKCSQIID